MDGTVLASLIPSPLPPPVFDRFQELQGRGRPRRSRHVQRYHVASGRQKLDRKNLEALLCDVCSTTGGQHLQK